MSSTLRDRPAELVLERGCETRTNFGEGIGMVVLPKHCAQTARAVHFSPGAYLCLIATPPYENCTWTDVC
jgi:hypothetical protein